MCLPKRDEREVCKKVTPCFLLGTIVSFHFYTMDSHLSTNKSPGRSSNAFIQYVVDTTASMFRALLPFRPSVVRWDGKFDGNGIWYCSGMVRECGDIGSHEVHHPITIPSDSEHPSRLEFPLSLPSHTHAHP